MPKQTSSGGLSRNFLIENKDAGHSSPPERSSPQLRSIFALRSLVSSQPSSTVRRYSASEAKPDRIEQLHRSPIRHAPRRIKSCMSPCSLRPSAENGPPIRKPKRTVSFGRVEGVIVKDIARENKNTLWFSSDEYKTMRDEAFQIALTIREKKAVGDTPHATSRGLERFVNKESTTIKTARLSVLEHQDLTMYSLASHRAVLEARETALLDALEAIAIQKESQRPSVCRRRSKLSP
ncbi:hypothetical protein FisN_19Hu013 [Fistulifera solaris]|uniref:Uncharacterized protein n=1 Tax=Fistulifera solaris TaxID=1519565 RepID=A0A1Z5K008_FISSO|nr:hypothetical protein FisN_19Hu013 [Fistulifera solaris]|eukprot:GAX19442.1 hypothetical protein FisN_19Hu013 [Fistulifera solaris]